LSAKIDKNKA